jgi:hypothetical protein
MKRVWHGSGTSTFIIRFCCVCLKERSLVLFVLLHTHIFCESYIPNKHKMHTLERTTR